MILTGEGWQTLWRTVAERLASTMRTKMTEHLRAQATGHGVAGHDDLTCTTRSRYKPRQPLPWSGPAGGGTH